MTLDLRIEYLLLYKQLLCLYIIVENSILQINLRILRLINDKFNANLKNERYKSNIRYNILWAFNNRNMRHFLFYIQIFYLIKSQYNYETKFVNKFKLSNFWNTYFSFYLTRLLTISLVFISSRYNSSMR